MKHYLAGQLARLTDTHIETIRYYQKIGLLPQAERNASNYRVFDQSHVEILYFIRKSRKLGFSIDEIRELLKLRNSAQTDRALVRDMTLRHIESIEHKIASLEKIRDSLKRLVAECPNGKISGCGIIDGLQENSDRKGAFEI